MNIIQIPEHADAIQIVCAVDMLLEMQPKNGAHSCTGMIEHGGCYVLLENNRGRYSAHIIEDATPEQAMNYARPFLCRANQKSTFRDVTSGKTGSQN